MANTFEKWRISLQTASFGPAGGDIFFLLSTLLLFIIIFKNMRVCYQVSKGYISQKYSIYLHVVYIYNSIFDIVKQHRTWHFELNLPRLQKL